MAKKETVEKTKSSPFKKVSENLPFWPEREALAEGVVKPFIGVYVGERILGDDPDSKENNPVYVFSEITTGENHFIFQSYAIKKALETARLEHKTGLDNVVFMFDYKGKTESKGKPFNLIDTGYCTLAEYQASL